MRILFTTQSQSLKMFDALNSALQNKCGVERAGFIIADSWAYREWLAESPDFESRGHLLLKEWHVTSRKDQKPDLQKLARYESELGGEAGLFGALVADR